jgi:predicted metal-binding membrane protein
MLARLRLNQPPDRLRPGRSIGARSWRLRAVTDRAVAAASSPGVPTLVAAIGGAWALAILVELSGTAGALHHHALIEHGPPIVVALPVFLVAWLVMVVAMMLPASLPAIRVFLAAAAARPLVGLSLARFVGFYALVWAAFGATAFLGDAVLHRIVDATPWLQARPWVIEAGVLALAGAYQFVPLKRRALDACRHPGDRHLGSVGSGEGAIRDGLRHGVDCLASSGALMLLMFAAGIADLWWMAALTAAMAYEAVGRHPRLAASLVGGALIAAAVVVAIGGWGLGFGAP